MLSVLFVPTNDEVVSSDNTLAMKIEQGIWVKEYLFPLEQRMNLIAEGYFTYFFTTEESLYDFRESW